MQPVTRYQADDGSEWPTAGQAEARDALCAFVRSAMAPLGTARELRDDTKYQQHAFAAVTAAKVALLRYQAERAQPFADWLEWE